MPVKFCFTKKDGTDEQLSTIDDKVAEFLGKTPEPDGGSAKFLDLVADTGIFILMGTTSEKITEENFNKWVSSLTPEKREKLDHGEQGNLLPCLRKFLYQDYTFRAWR